MTGGTLTSATGAVGFRRDSTGSLSVSGATSALEVSTFFNVGASGTGSLTVENGARAQISDTGTLGTNLRGNGSVTVTGVDSTLAATNFRNVGFEGAGTLRVEAGGGVTSGTGSIATVAGSTGEATVTGADSTWVDGALNVGFGGVGSLEIADGGVVTASAGTVLGVRSGAPGRWTSTWEERSARTRSSPETGIIR